MKEYYFANVVDIKTIDKTLSAIKEKAGVVNAGKLFREDKENDMIWFLCSNKTDEKTTVEEIKNLPNIDGVIPKLEWEMSKLLKEEEE